MLQGFMFFFKWPKNIWLWTEGGVKRTLGEDLYFAIASMYSPTSPLVRAHKSAAYHILLCVGKCYLSGITSLFDVFYEGYTHTYLLWPSPNLSCQFTSRFISNTPMLTTEKSAVILEKICIYMCGGVSGGQVPSSPCGYYEIDRVKHLKYSILTLFIFTSCHLSVIIALLHHPRNPAVVSSSGVDLFSPPVRAVLQSGYTSAGYGKSRLDPPCRLRVFVLVWGIS